MQESKMRSQFGLQRNRIDNIMKRDMDDVGTIKQLQIKLRKFNLHTIEDSCQNCRKVKQYYEALIIQYKDKINILQHKLSAKQKHTIRNLQVQSLASSIDNSLTRGKKNEYISLSSLAHSEKDRVVITQKFDFKQLELQNQQMKRIQQKAQRLRNKEKKERQLLKELKRRCDGNQNQCQTDRPDFRLDFRGVQLKKNQDNYNFSARTMVQRHSLDGSQNFTDILKVKAQSIYPSQLEEIQQLKRQCYNLQSQNKNFRQQIILQKRLLQNYKEECQRDQLNAKRSHENCQETILTNCKTIKRLNDQNRHLEELLTQYKNKARQQQQTLTISFEKYKNFSKQTDMLKKSLEYYQKQIDILQIELKKLHDENVEKTNQTMKKNSMIEEYLIEVSNLSSLTSQYEQKISTLEIAEQEKMHLLTDYEKMNKQLQQEITFLNSKLDETEQKIVDKNFELENYKKDMTEQIKLLNKKLQQLAKYNQQRQAFFIIQLQKKQQELGRYNQHIQQLKENLEEENRSKQRILLLNSNRQESTRQQLSNKQQSLKKLQKQLQEKMQKIANEGSARIKKLQCQNGMLKQKISSKQVELILQIKQKNKLKNKLEQKDNIIHEFMDNVQQLQRINYENNQKMKELEDFMGELLQEKSIIEKKYEQQHQIRVQQCKNFNEKLEEVQKMRQQLESQSIILKIDDYNKQQEEKELMNQLQSLRKEIEMAKNKLDWKQKQVHDTQQLLKNSEKANKQLFMDFQKRTKQFQKIIQQYQVKEQKLQVQIKIFKKKIDEYEEKSEQEKNKKNLEMEVLYREIKQLKEERQECIKQMGEKISQRQKIDEEMRQLKDKFEQAERQVNQWKSKHQQSEKKLSQWISKHQETDKQVNQLIKKAQQADNQIRQLKNEYEQANKQVNQWKSKHQQSEKELSQWKKKYQQAQEQLSQWRSKPRCRKQVNQWKKKHQLAQKQYKQISQWKKKHQLAQNQLSQRMNKAQQADKQVKQWKNKHQLAQKQLIQWRSKHQQAQKQIMQLRSKYLQADKQIKELKKNSEQANIQVSQWKKKAQQTQKQLIQWRSKHQQAQKQLSQQINKAQQTDKQWKNKHQLVYKQIRQLKNIAQQTERQVSQWKNKHQKAENQISQLKNESEQAERQVNQWIKKHQQTQNLFSQWKNKHQQSQKQLTQWRTKHQEAAKQASQWINKYQQINKQLNQQKAKIILQQQSISQISDLKSKLQLSQKQSIAYKQQSLQIESNLKHLQQNLQKKQEQNSKYQHQLKQSIQQISQLKNKISQLQNYLKQQQFKSVKQQHLLSNIPISPIRQYGKIETVLIQDEQDQQSFIKSINESLLKHHFHNTQMEKAIKLLLTELWQKPTNQKFAIMIQQYFCRIERFINKQKSEQKNNMSLAQVMQKSENVLAKFTTPKDNEKSQISSIQENANNSREKLVQDLQEIVKQSQKKPFSPCAIKSKSMEKSPEEMIEDDYKSKNSKASVFLMDSLVEATSQKQKQEQLDKSSKNQDIFDMQEKLGQSLRSHADTKSFMSGQYSLGQKQTQSLLIQSKIEDQYKKAMRQAKAKGKLKHRKTLGSNKIQEQEN